MTAMTYRQASAWPTPIESQTLARPVDQAPFSFSSARQQTERKQVQRSSIDQRVRIML